MIERNLPLKNVPRRLSSFAADGESRSVPKYELLKRALLDYISELPPEREFLPYEKELAGEFGVSRCTVTKALEKLRRGRTTIVGAHRLATVRGADHIAVIDKEGVSEYGTHQELMEKNGLYAALWNTQKLS